jgi:hypothetical protein
MSPARQPRQGAAQVQAPPPAQAQAAAPGRRMLANLYERWTLDIIPCLGQPCAELCRDYPQEFKNVPADTLATLADLLYRTGYDSSYLDEQGRKALLMSVLGDSDGCMGGARSGVFHRSADALRCRANDFVNRVFTTGEAQLRNAFRDAATTFQSYLRTVDGNVVADANVRLTKHFDDVVTILQTREFAAGLGLPPAPAAPWPLNLTNPIWDGDGAMLVYAVTKRAQASGGTPIVKNEEFLQIQRIATYGAETIQAVLTGAAISSTNKTTDTVIDQAHRWSTAITELTGTPGVPAS